MLRDIKTVFWRDWIVLKKRLTKFIFSRMVAPILYLTAFGLGLGRNVQLESGNYLDFIVPGIIALNSMNISFHSIIPIHAERVYHKSLEEYLLSPISAESFLIGKILGAVLRAIISSAIIIVLAKIFGANFSLSPSFFAIIILNSIIFAEIGFIAAMKLSTYEENNLKDTISYINFKYNLISKIIIMKHMKIYSIFYLMQFYLIIIEIQMITKIIMLRKRKKRLFL